MAITIRKIPSPSGSISNSDNSYTASVASGGSLSLPDSQININGIDEGDIASVKTIDINITDGTNPVVPDAVSLSGSTLDVEVPAYGWERPDDWLAMPSVTSSDDTFVGLHAVFEGGANFVAFTFTTDTGDYQVDWGDGNVDVVASNTQAQHQYDYSTYDIGNTTLSTRGYKQAIITVTPVSGELRTANFQKRYTTTPTIAFPYSSGFLDCILSMPYANTGRSITFGDTTIIHAMVERFDVKTIGNATSLQDMFQNCYSLQELPLFDTSNITNMELMFYFCYSLQTIPLLNTSNVTNMVGMFYECYSLKNIPLLDTSNATNMASMFYFCRSLQTIPLLNTSNVTIVSNMFSNCFSLQEVPLFDTSNVTNMQAVFASCSSLQSIPFLDTSNVTNMQSMFVACYSLQEVPALNTTSVTNQTSQFLFCQSLAKTDIICRKSVSFSRALLSQSELVNIFNNLIDLTGLTSQNINITSCWGASALTVAERQIATDKNWTITG
jgi:surface protein